MQLPLHTYLSLGPSLQGHVPYLAGKVLGDDPIVEAFLILVLGLQKLAGEGPGP